MISTQVLLLGVAGAGASWVLYQTILTKGRRSFKQTKQAEAEGSGGVLDKVADFLQFGKNKQISVLRDNVVMVLKVWTSLRRRLTLLTARGTARTRGWRVCCTSCGAPSRRPRLGVARGRLQPQEIRGRRTCSWTPRMVVAQVTGTQSTKICIVMAKIQYAEFVSRSKLQKRSVEDSRQFEEEDFSEDSTHLLSVETMGGAFRLIMSMVIAYFMLA